MAAMRFNRGTAIAFIAAGSLLVTTPASFGQSKVNGDTHSSAAAAKPPAIQPRGRARQIAAQTLAAFIQDHDRAKAEHGFLQVTQIDPDYAPAWFNLAVFSEGERRWATARHDFGEYLRLSPSGPDAGRAKDQLQLIADYKDGAEPAAVKQGDYDAMIQRARAFLAANLFREAIAEAGRAETADNSRWESYAVVSLCMAKQHKWEPAAKFRELAVNHAPSEKREQVQAALATQFAIDGEPERREREKIIEQNHGCNPANCDPLPPQRAQPNAQQQSSTDH